MRFLCSYHAFNRCDGAGVVGKRLAKVQQKQSKGPVGAAARSDLINTSAYHNHVSFSFDTINRGVDVFPAGLDKLPHARQCCDIKYHHTKDGEDVRKEGVVWFKKVSEVDTPYQLHDLLADQRQGSYMCVQCSNTQLIPVFHAEVTDCPRTSTQVDLQAVCATPCVPDPARIQGPQVLTQKQLAKGTKATKQPQKKRAAPKVIGAYPCKHPRCDMVHYTTTGGSNRHMASVHTDVNLEPYPVPSKQGKTATKKARLDGLLHSRSLHAKGSSTDTLHLCVVLHRCGSAAERAQPRPQRASGDSRARTRAQHEHAGGRIHD